MHDLLLHTDQNSLIAITVSPDFAIMLVLSRMGHKFSQLGSSLRNYSRRNRIMHISEKHETGATNMWRVVQSAAVSVALQ